MSKSSEGRTSALSFDGALPLAISSGRMTFATSADSNNGRFMIPFGCTLERLYYSIVTTSTATGTRNMNVGTASDADKFVDATSITVPSALEMREVDLTATDGTVPSRTITAGEELQFELGAGVAGGVVIATAIVSPNSG